MRKNSDSGVNYLPYVLGGLFLVALAVIFAYAFVPFEGCVGVVRISGEIVSESSDATLFSDEVKGADTIVDEIEEASDRQDVKALLILVDSPGGSVVASREIYDALKKANKTTVAYIHELAASGGYYAAAGTDYIVANPNAITGSIGARITLQDLSGLFEKVGFNVTTVKSGEKKDMGSGARPITDEERAVLESIVNESFGEFRSAIEESRGSRLDGALFQSALDGRILSGRQAKRIGLVDELGGKKEAIGAAARLAGIGVEEPGICEISLADQRRGIFGSLVSGLSGLFSKSGGASLQYR